MLGGFVLGDALGLVAGEDLAGGWAVGVAEAKDGADFAGAGVGEVFLAGSVFFDARAGCGCGVGGVEEGFGAGGCGCGCGCGCDLAVWAAGTPCGAADLGAAATGVGFGEGVDFFFLEAIEE